MKVKVYYHDEFIDKEKSEVYDIEMVDYEGECGYDVYDDRGKKLLTAVGFDCQAENHDYQEIASFAFEEKHREAIKDGYLTFKDAEVYLEQEHEKEQDYGPVL